MFQDNCTYYALCNCSSKDQKLFPQGKVKKKNRSLFYTLPPKYNALELSVYNVIEWTLTKLGFWLNIFCKILVHTQVENESNTVGTIHL